MRIGMLEAVCFAVVMLGAGPALAACHISDLPCAAAGKKCNITFVNNTGKSSGSGGGTEYSQVSYATTLKLRAEKKDGTRAGGNTIKILAQAKKTMNMDKKKDFDHIKIWSSIATNTSKGAFRLDCNHIRSILQHNNRCRLYVSKTKQTVGTRKTTGYYLSYNCRSVSGSSNKPFAVYHGS